MAVRFGTVTKVSKFGWKAKASGSVTLSALASNRLVVFVSHRPGVIEVDCYEVRRELSDYLEGDLTPELWAQINWHLENCRHCTAVYDGMRSVVRLIDDERAIELPDGFGQRPYKRLFPPC